MSLTEFDEEAFKQEIREEGREEGKQEKALDSAIEFLKEKIAPETIAKCLKLPLQEVLELQKKAI